MFCFTIIGRPFFLLVYLVFLLFSGVEALASVLTVNTPQDTHDSVCDSDCSLRDAISAAATGDSIVFERNLRGGVIFLNSSLVIDKRLTIDGPNKRRITLAGNGSFRILHITIPANPRLVTLDGLIIKDGGEQNGDGGGIYVDPRFTSILNIVNCAILNNKAQRGGGIYQENGTLYLIDSAVANNTASGDDSAGGMDIFRATVRIFNSTIAWNQNTSQVNGAGGIRLTISPLWSINGSTIAFNSSAGTEENTSAGGLVVLNGIPGSISNLILAKNSGINPDFQGRVSFNANNFIGVSDEDSGFINGVNGNIVGSTKIPLDPQLNTLTDNGGALPTLSLRPRSGAIDSGSNILATDRFGDPQLRDQRGYNRIIGGVVDMGAYEHGASPLAENSTIMGQIKNVNGRVVSGARIVLRDSNGNIRTTLTNPFGYYRFFNVPIGTMQEITCFDKRGTFSPQTLLIEESVEYINF